MSQDVTDKSDEFIHCPTCAGLGSIKRWEIEKRESKLREFAINAIIFSAAIVCMVLAVSALWMFVISTPLGM